MDAIQRINALLDLGWYDRAGERLKCLIDVNIEHVDHECLEVKFYKENWTTAPFHFLIERIKTGAFYIF